MKLFFLALATRLCTIIFAKLSGMFQSLLMSPAPAPKAA